MKKGMSKSQKSTEKEKSKIKAKKEQKLVEERKKEEESVEQTKEIGIKDSHRIHANTGIFDEPDEEQKKFPSTNWEVKKSLKPFYSGGKVSIVPDHPDLILSMCNSMVHILDVNKGVSKIFLQKQNEELLTFAVDPINPQFIVTCSQNNLVRKWETPPNYYQEIFISSQEKPKCIAAFKTQKSLAISLAYDSKSAYLAAGCNDGSVKIIDNKANALLHSFSGHRGLVLHVLFHPSKTLLFSSAEDGIIKIWDLVMESCIATLKGPKSPLTCINFTNDSATLIGSSRDSVISFWSLKNYKRIAVIEHTDPINALHYFNPGSEEDPKPRLVMGGEAGQLSILDINTKTIIAKQTKPLKQEILYLVKQVPQNLIAVTTDHNYLFYKFTGQDIERIEERSGFLDEIIDVKFLKPPSLVLLANNSEIIKLVNLETMQQKLIQGHHDIVMELAVRWPYFASASKDNTIRIYSIQEKQSFSQHVIKCLAVVKGHTLSVTSISLSNKGTFPSFLVSVSQDKTLKQWNLPPSIFEGNKTFLIKEAEASQVAHEKYINTVALAPNDKLVATASQDRRVKVYATSKLEHKWTLTGHRRGVWSVKFSPTEKLLASCSGDMTVKVWNVSQGVCSHTLQGHQGSVVRLEWIFHGLQIMSFGVQGVAKIWNLKKSKCINTFECHEQGSRVWGIHYSQKYRAFVTGGTDSEMHYWKDVSLQVQSAQAEAQSQKLKEAQLFSNKMYQGQLEEAALMAFKMGRVRDLIGILKSSLKEKDKMDPITSLIKDMEEFDGQFTDPQNPLAQLQTQKLINQKLFRTIVKKLIEQDHSKLLEIVRDFNTRGQYAEIAQKVLQLCIQSLETERLFTLRSSIKRGKQRKEETVMAQIQAYSGKHKRRYDSFYRDSFFLEYILREMGVLKKRYL